MSKIILSLLSIILLLTSQPAAAYVGPGLGLGTLGVILGVVVSVLLAAFAILWYPIKKLIKKRKSSKSKPNSSSE